MGFIDPVGTLRELTKLNYRPTPCLMETWQTEDIPALVWGTTLVGTGTVAFSAAEPPYLKVILGGAATIDEATLYGLHRWFCNPDAALAGYLKQSIFQILHMEFEAKFVNLNVFDNTNFFMGLGSTQAAIETTNNIIGFALDDTDNLDFLSADAAAITRVGDVILAGELDDWHKYEIIVEPGAVHCLINGAIAGTITANLAEAALYPIFHLVQENTAGTPALHVAVIRIWSEDILR